MADDDPTTDVCVGHEDASWCAGPSDGCELSERSARGYCPGEGAAHEAERCEGTMGGELVDGECVTVAETAPPAPPPGGARLPHTGADVSGLLLPAVLAIAAGAALLRRVA